MAKTATRCLEADPWIVEEKGFHSGRGEVSESVFSLGNELMGVRGYFEEGFSGHMLLGSYFNGVFERLSPPRDLFRGISVDAHAMMNAVDWLHTASRLPCGGLERNFR